MPTVSRAWSLRISQQTARNRRDEKFVRCNVTTAGMVQVANEDECGAGLQLSRDGFMIIGASIWTPEMRARNADSGTVLFGCFCDGRHTAQHHGHIAVSRVIVTIDSLAIRNAMLF